MSAYQAFTTARTTEPDRDALFTQLRALDPTVGITEHRIGSPGYVLKKATAWTGPQIAAAQNVLDNAPASTPQLAAQALVDKLPLHEKAWKLIEVEEFNRLRAALRALGAPGLPDLTLDQVLAAWRTKAGEIS